MGRLNFADPEAAAQDLLELQKKRDMTDSLFQKLHHRRNLGPKDGIAAHLRYLAKPSSGLRGDHQQTARRILACLELRKVGVPWPEAIRLAEEQYPGARSK